MTAMPIVTDDGRTVSGLLADRDDQVVVLRGVDGEDITVIQDRIPICSHTHPMPMHDRNDCHYTN